MTISMETEEDLAEQRSLSAGACSCVLPGSQKAETTQTPFARGADEQMRSLHPLEYYPAVRRGEMLYTPQHRWNWKALRCVEGVRHLDSERGKSIGTES